MLLLPTFPSPAMLEVMDHYHHGNLKESLIQAGDEELKARGLKELSLRALSRKLKVSHNAPYRHFADKNALLDEILRRTLGELTDRLQEAELIYPYSPVHQIQYFGRAWALLTLKHPRKSELLINALIQEGDKGPLHIQFRNMLEALESLLRSHESADRETDPKLTARALIASFIGNGLAVASRAFEIERDEDAFLLFDHIVENLLNA